MVRITEDLVRKKSEHNECEISTLEELSLHQEDIEKIEHLQNWCRHLKILLLQSNLISKIENLSKLKALQYLNLALNNIERIENLERLESLEKLDLTLNFIGELSSVKNLKENYNLKILFLTGNPCTDYQGYRKYVITVLPQLHSLDGGEISRSDRIVANQDFFDCAKSIKWDEKKYKESKILKKSSDNFWENEDREMTDEELKRFWELPSQNTPEDRIAIAKVSRKMKDLDKKKGSENEKLKPPKLFTNDGRPLNVNRSRIPYKLVDDDENGCKILDVAVYKYLDTSLIDVNLNPTYITVTIKGKVLQLVFDEEIAVDTSICQRSQTTGHLVVSLKKVNAILKPKPAPQKEVLQTCEPSEVHSSKREYLEIGQADNVMDFANIVENNRKKKQELKLNNNVNVIEKKPSPDFVDDDEVPPLI